MKVTGTSTLAAEPAAVFRALNDPAVLVRSIPGCQRLVARGADSFAMTVAAGVGSIQGVYDGEVRLTDHDEPSSFRLKANGAGAPGTIGADVLVTLQQTDGGTLLSYDADAVVGGMIGGVGQRMLTGVSRRMAEEFFANVEAALAGTTPGAPADGVAPEPGGPPAPGAVPAGTVFTAPPAPAGRGPGFALGVLAGAGAALAGALVGAWIAGRRGRR